MKKLKFIILPFLMVFSLFLSLWISPKVSAYDSSWSLHSVRVWQGNSLDYLGNGFFSFKVNIDDVETFFEFTMGSEDDSSSSDFELSLFNEFWSLDISDEQSVYFEFVDKYYNTIFYWNPQTQKWQLDEVTVADYNPVFEGETAFVTNVDNPMSLDDILSHIKLIDVEDGDVSHRITVVSDNYTENKNIVGTYEILLSGTDTKGNEASLTVFVLVKDVNVPEITGQDVYDQSYSKKLNVADILSSLSVTDNYDTDLNINVDSDNYSSNYSQLGSYTINFSCTDSNNNKGTFVVTVNVIDDIAPIFTGPETILKSQSEILSVADIKNQLTANDFISEEVEISVKEDNYTGNGNKIGSYTIIFEANDEAGNVGTHTVTVTVADNIPPVFYVDNFFITVEQSVVLTRDDIIALLQASNQLSGSGIMSVNFLVNEYEGNEDVPGIYGMTLKVASSDGSGEQISLVVKVIEDFDDIIIQPTKSFFVKTWDWLINPVKDGSKFYNGYWVLIAIAGIALIIVLVPKGKKNYYNRRNHRRSRR